MRRLTALLLLFTVSLTAQNVQLDASDFGNIKARHIGPAVMSGRITSIDALHSNPLLIYTGAAGGGLWKTTNGGNSFEPVFDAHNQCISTITMDQQHPDTVWVGTGEIWVRNSVSVGDGIYKTTNGGDKWVQTGLENSERISRIIINPDNPDIVYAAVLGHLWNSNEERGVYKTTDGGENWTKILYIDENTGCTDPTINPANPDKLLAAMWDFRRKPWTFRSGGPGSGLYATEDGGDSWNKVTGGLPEDTLGRIAVRCSPADPELAFALVESENSALYRSRDGGKSWHMISDNPLLSERPFYFSLLVPDPVDPARVYKPGFQLNVSNDTGRTFVSPYLAGGNVHPDHHALWISKGDNDLIYAGTDGGMYISRNHGATWDHVNNLPVSQFYHVSTDLKTPYNIYGGLQDNGTWRGPSESPGGIGNDDWDYIGYGDGFNAYKDPADDNIFYVQYQEGNVMRLHLDTRETKDIRPYSDDIEDDLRFNWNTPVYLSPVEKNTMFIGAQFLYKSTDRGDSWEKLSPDLTTDDPEKQQQHKSGGITIDNTGAENHCTIYTISQSRQDKSIIWTGSDDGMLYVTSDGGGNWTEVGGNIPSLPENTWCSFVEADRFDAATVYVSFDGHRTGDMSAYIYKTTDLGATWQKLSDESVESYVHIVRQDIENPELLFAGTEAGLYISVDGGGSWTRFEGDVPKVSIRDMVIQPEENDLVLGTHGRGILIIDDISSFRQLTPEVLKSELYVLESAPSIITNAKFGQGLTGDEHFAGSNEGSNAFITYYLSKRHVFGKFFIEMYDPEGNLIKELPAGKNKGINRVEFNLRLKPPKVKARNRLLAFRTAFGPNYPPGDYKFRIVKKDKSYEGALKLILDPEFDHSPEEYRKQHESLMKLYELINSIAALDEKVVKLTGRLKAVKEKPEASELEKNMITLTDALNVIHNKLVNDDSNYLAMDNKMIEDAANLYGSLNNYFGEPGQSQLERIALLSENYETLQQEYSGITETVKNEINPQLKTIGISEINMP